MKMSRLMSGLLLGASLICATPAFAADVTTEGAWSRAMPPSARVLPVYVTLRNSSAEDVSLVSVSSTYGQAELHETVMENDMMKMLPINAIVVGSNKQVQLAPMGLHVMITNLALDVPSKGSTLPITLTFDNGETISLDVKVTSQP